jgi:glycerol uptake facilitator protein
MRLPLTAILGGGGVAAAGLSYYSYSTASLRVRSPLPTPLSFSSVNNLPFVTLKKLAHEAIGTGLIVLLGCGSVCSVKYLGSGMTLGGVSIIWGTGVALAVYGTRDASGAHLNPAVTVALAVHRPQSTPPALAIAYVGAQTLGASLAAALNYAVFSRAIAAFEAKEGVVRGTPASAASYAGAFGMVPNPLALRAPGAAFATEVLATSVLTYLVFSLTDPASSVPPAAAPALIGATVTTLVSVFGPVTGAGMNPARDLGPRLVTLLSGWKGAALQGAPIYTIGPIVGAVLGGGMYDAVKRLE